MRQIVSRNISATVDRSLLTPWCRRLRPLDGTASPPSFHKGGRFRPRSSRPAAQRNPPSHRSARRPSRLTICRVTAAATKHDVVIDVSVALKWVIEEDGSEAARALLLEGPLVAPDLLIVECAKVLMGEGAARPAQRRCRGRGPGYNPSGSDRAAACGRLRHGRPSDSLRP